MFAADDGIEFIGTLLHLLHSGIGHKVEDKQGCIYTCHHIGNLQVEQSVAAKAQVDAFAIEPTFQDVSMRHAGTGSATTLQDACSVEHHRFIAYRQVNGRLTDLREGVYADGKGSDAVI